MVAKHDIASDGRPNTDLSAHKDPSVDFYMYFTDNCPRRQQRPGQTTRPEPSAVSHQRKTAFPSKNVEGKLLLAIFWMEQRSAEYRWVSTHLPVRERRLDELTPKRVSSRSEELLKLAGILSGQENRREGCPLATGVDGWA